MQTHHKQESNGSPNEPSSGGNGGISGNNAMVFNYNDAKDGFEAETSGMHV
jgi:hypothetical protein